jgi:carboxyl-terminal processing protease
MNSGVISKFAFQYCDQNRRSLKQTFSNLDEFQKKFELSETEIKRFKEFSVTEGIQVIEPSWRKSFELIRLQLKAQIARNLWGNDGFFKVIEAKDKTVLKAIEVLR